MRKAPYLLAILLVSACSKGPELSRGRVWELIEGSEAFAAPIDPGIVFVDTKYRPTENTRRELVSLLGVAIKDDGPFAIAGRTATVAFTWKWNEGPFAGSTMKSKAKLTCAGGYWKVYDDYLKHQLWLAERGESED